MKDILTYRCFESFSLKKDLINAFSSIFKLHPNIQPIYSSSFLIYPASLYRFGNTKGVTLTLVLQQVSIITKREFLIKKFGHTRMHHNIKSVILRNV